MIVCVITPTSAESKQYTTIDNSTYHKIIDNIYENTATNQYVVVENGLVSGSAVAIFVAGMVIGWIVEGIITNATGRSPSKWVAYATAALVDFAAGLWRNSVSYFMNLGTPKVVYAKKLAGCILGNPQGTIYHCPMRISS